ncbi:transcription antitermination factor NusB [Panacibacter ginsenosidivorans]|uniref:Transcription antitermination factor NusB n=1 Tax=Panacibacter ginsenosidivorans TaxID=1813871 RepID=A0A5B8VFL6_9BACT|nr:transcription antitermination factor NusB [Panacibacter ginsenosidivorans]QEC69782.1 transcription antitermination factor NusB [Panacibacter ginsenosidivorans]
MISRRNIRVKVMQELYALQAIDGAQDKINPVDNLKKSLDLTTGLFVYLLYFITEVARYAEKDAKQRALRNLPSAADKNVNTKISGNELLWRILENESFKKEKATRTLAFPDTEDQVKKTYNELAATDNYKQYILAQGRDKKAEKDMLIFIFTNLMLPNEDFIQHIEEHFTNWDDDAEMMDQLMLNYLQKPGSYSLQQMVGEEKWKFAKDLLVTTFNKKDYALELIKPKLKNWDSERIAALDMILMQMGVCEFLYFETIPPKVTINEYIDLAKEYSTPQSGQFVNGILDSIHKELLSQDKIHKIDFKQKA